VRCLPEEEGAWDVPLSDQVQQSNPAPFFDLCKKRWILMLVWMIELADVG